MTTFRRVGSDGSISTGDSLSPDQIELLKRRGDMFAGFVADSAPIVDDFIQRVVGDPAPYVANLDRFVDALDEMLGNAEVADADKMFVFTRLMYFIGEYLIRRHRGSWQIDAVPFSPTFGHYVIQVPLDEAGLGLLSVSPSELAKGVRGHSATPPAAAEHRRARPAQHVGAGFGAMRTDVIAGLLCCARPRGRRFVDVHASAARTTILGVGWSNDACHVPRGAPARARSLPSE